MSNVQTDPSVLDCRPDPSIAAVQVLTPREVPLGGPRAMTVRRTLPHKDRSFVGAWCFVDHYGPQDVSVTGGMDVPPHPHTGLQTVSWLFSGNIEHHDSGGGHAVIRPGELVLMTSGYGIAHSEVSTPDTTSLHGVQLWVVLPQAAATTDRALQRFVPPAVTGDGVTTRTFLGRLGEASSPVRTFTPLLGVEVSLDPGASWTSQVNPTFEHAVLIDRGSCTMDGTPIVAGDLGIRDPGVGTLELVNTGTEVAVLLLLGGTPFTEPVIMWWNFIGRSTDEIAQMRQQWQTGSERFGNVPDYAGAIDRLPAPVMPPGRLRPRGLQG